MRKLIIETSRDGYATDQIRSTMTVEELRNMLDNYDDDMPVYLSFDNGYTYGGIEERDFEERDDDDEE